MNQPRLTEERLRYYLDGNQPDRERLCLAALPFLGPFAHCRPRRPKGGPDGARDIECSCNGDLAWGAIGFRNGGGADVAARNAIKRKFLSDLRSALSERSDLSIFIFFTNVDLTPKNKADLTVEARSLGVKEVYVFDMEIIRNFLDSHDGLLARQQFLDIQPTVMPKDWSVLQSTKIFSFDLGFRVPASVDKSKLTAFHEQFAQLLAGAFNHACATTPFDDFVFILETTENPASEGFVPIVFSVHCHITAFMWAYQEFCQFHIEGSTKAISTYVQGPSSPYKVRSKITFDRFVPHRIYRSGANEVTIEDISAHPPQMANTITTSTLLRLLARMHGAQLMVFDGVDKWPDFQKMLGLFARINDAGLFLWDHFQLDRNNPESWEYIGDR